VNSESEDTAQCTCAYGDPPKIDTLRFAYQEACSRGVWVYPYPRVYPTQPVPAGTGRVGYGYDVHGYGYTRFYP